MIVDHRNTIHCTVKRLEVDQTLIVKNERFAVVKFWHAFTPGRRANPQNPCGHVKEGNRSLQMV